MRRTMELSPLELKDMEEVELQESIAR